MSRERLRSSRENNSPFAGDSVEIYVSPTKATVFSNYSFSTGDYVTIKGSDDEDLLIPRQIALHSGYAVRFNSHCKFALVLFLFGV